MGISKFFSGVIILDSPQIEATSHLNIISKTLNKPKSIFNFFSNRSFYKGVYLYGGVGRGKTMLMQAFYKSLNIKKQFIHCQDFMQFVHINLHALQKISSNKIIDNLALEIARSAKVICLDEFEIKDIADAMIIGKLFEALASLDVFVVVTSNTKPINLYKDGLQRESFLPFIDFIDNKFDVIYLDNNHDYRQDKVVNVGDNRIIYPLNQHNKQNMAKVVDKVTQNKLVPFEMQIFGRKIEFNKTHDKALITNFTELFERELGYVDYVNICRYFKIIILEDVPVLLEDNTDLTTRFINFIDNAYFNKVLLYMSLACHPAKLYIKGKRLAEFNRTISRLYEMNSKNYLKMIYE